MSTYNTAKANARDKANRGHEDYVIWNALADQWRHAPLRKKRADWGDVQPCSAEVIRHDYKAPTCY